MLVLKYLLVILGIGLFGSSGALVVYDIYLSSQLRRLLSRRPGRRERGVCAPFTASPLGTRPAARGGGSAASLGGVQHCGGARRIRGSARQPNLGSAPRHVVSGRASHHAARR